MTNPVAKVTEKQDLGTVQDSIPSTSYFCDGVRVL